MRRQQVHLELIPIRVWLLCRAAAAEGGELGVSAASPIGRQGLKKTLENRVASDEIEVSL
jgi:hypothetical protein